MFEKDFPQGDEFDPIIWELSGGDVLKHNDVENTDVELVLSYYLRRIIEACNKMMYEIAFQRKVKD